MRDPLKCEKVNYSTATTKIQKHLLRFLPFLSFRGVGEDRSESDTNEESLKRGLVVSLELATFVSESLSALLVPGCFLFFFL